jgi:hypothetical protein
MRTIKLIPTAFYQFKILAKSIRLMFDCKLTKGMYFVTADSDLLESIGY